jgi:hypothetical protein
MHPDKAIRTRCKKFLTFSRASGGPGGEVGGTPCLWPLTHSGCTNTVHIFSISSKVYVGECKFEKRIRAGKIQGEF